MHPQPSIKPGPALLRKEENIFAVRRNLLKAFASL